MSELLPRIPFVDLAAQYRRLGPEIDARIRAVLDHGRFIMGPEVAELEATLAEFAGVGHAVGVSSGTDALLMALMAENIGPGDAVFVPTFTFTATAEVVLLLGATPVFVDVDAHLFNIDPGDLERRIAEIDAAGELTSRAVIAVDLYGLPADYAALSVLCEARDLFLLADGAQSFGASLEGRPVGSLAAATATSFFPSKPLGCYGDGGALLTDDGVRAACYRSIRAHGKGDAKYDIVRLGLNARLDTLQAAILLAKLPHFAAEITARERVAAAYDAGLAGIVETPTRIAGAHSAWAQYTILHDARDALASALKDRGVPSMIYYPRPMHLQTAYAGFGAGEGSLPVAESLSGRVLSLPVHPDLAPETAERIITALRDSTD
jgi:UDP-2-acetamido-2-deoxy-ribo-hexuluronate aminotransferase